MALFPKSLPLFLALFMAIISSSHAFTLEVGGTKGWTLNPSETYSAWSQRLRFSVNDTLHFKYNAATDSVLVVSKADFDNCNANNPITKLDGGDSSFTFDRSGPFFFITGNKTNCDQGQKIHIVVLAIRNNQVPNSPAVSPSPDASAPTAASPAPAPAEADISPAPVSGISPAPVTGVSPAPVTGASPAPGTNPADGSTAPAGATEGTPAGSGASTFNADSTVPFVMILGLAFALFVC